MDYTESKIVTRENELYRKETNKISFEELHEIVSEKEKNICQIVAYKDGKKVYSDTWNDYKSTDCCHVMSVTKSIVALLVGIAIEKGYIESVDQPVLDFFPNYKIKRGEKTIQNVTIRHLLTMTAPYKYKYEPWSRICSTEDWTTAALDFLGGRSGITGEFKYSTLGIHILTGIISKTSGMTTVSFANRYLFAPIGVKEHVNYLAKNVEEHEEFTISKLPRKNVWFCDQKGVGTAGYGLCFSAEDMAKIGQMCLEGGMFQGKRIISKKWLEECTRCSCECGGEFQGLHYGYLWWLIKKEEKSYAAIGNSGNVIYINPAKNIVIAITAAFKPTVFDRIDFIIKYVEPAMQS